MGHIRDLILDHLEGGACVQLARGRPHVIQDRLHPRGRALQALLTHVGRHQNQIRAPLLEREQGVPARTHADLHDTGTRRQSSEHFNREHATAISATGSILVVLPPLAFRPFHEDDLYRVLQLANDALDENYDGGLFLHFARLYPEGFIVVEAGDELVAFILGTVQRAYEARILALAVSDEWRRRGIASQLVKRFMDAFARGGVRKITLEVRVSNEEAIELYHRLGFDKKGLLQAYYGDGEDAYVMARSIA